MSATSPMAPRTFVLGTDARVALSIPADGPDIARRLQTPVVVLEEETRLDQQDSPRTLTRGDRGVVWGQSRIAVEGDLVRRLFWVLLTRTPALVEVPLDILGVDLFDPTGRAHATWWAAKKLGVQNPTATSWGRCEARGGPWLVMAEDGAHGDMKPSEPIFNGLDFHDPRLLPDGSRWVDAAALQRFVLHLAERGGEE